MDLQPILSFGRLKILCFACIIYFDVKNPGHVWHPESLHLDIKYPVSEKFPLGNEVERPQSSPYIF